MHVRTNAYPSHRGHQPRKETFRGKNNLADVPDDRFKQFSYINEMCACPALAYACYQFRVNIITINIDVSIVDWWLFLSPTGASVPGRD